MIPVLISSSTVRVHKQPFQGIPHRLEWNGTTYAPQKFDLSNRITLPYQEGWRGLYTEAPAFSSIGINS